MANNNRNKATLITPINIVDTEGDEPIGTSTESDAVRILCEICADREEGEPKPHRSLIADRLTKLHPDLVVWWEPRREKHLENVKWEEEAEELDRMRKVLEDNGYKVEK